MSRRTERVAELLREEIARILTRDASDPRLALLTLVRVEVTSDLSDAKVLWSFVDPRGERDGDEIQTALERATSFVRARLAERLDLRRIPVLHFRRDTSIEEGDRTLAILRDLAREREEPERHDET